ncbi:hypothetical protein CBI38_30800 (plasmid) [Rhodococcus oxybenzonivorans]|jgi:hypothetical protein|uniref:Uncharacterized protein n=5 Tax=Nocardiaceae TaxID=85025 RepID=A0A2S2C578_9NOCA|nr:hypothetical protein CBI38_30800 [Rhodococcus oxybenzonivorans]EID74470.1 hypothetical protein W59_30204 [Rhodococcus opacus RKJ300 = JCM 13270]QQZ18537.1 hypothetical protein GO592_41045 [Rhodococcus sp. 21391]GCE37728.1 hypothetical protein Rhow_000574 [Rhodococcus wratislaviensis]SEB73526.1 hypothetical protein SAMN04490239_1442 [Rhodococcus koreensis]
MYRSRTPAAAIHRSFAHGGSMSTRQIKAHLEVMFAPETDHGAPGGNAGSVLAHRLSEVEENTVPLLAGSA